MLLGGFLASKDHLDIAILCVLVVVAAVVGDSVGYEVGRLFGPRVVRWRLLDRHQARLALARGTLRDRGGPAIFLGRFTAFFRAVMPGLAGLSEMQYRRFLVWNALGGLIWGVGFCLVGYFAGASYEKVAAKIGTGSALVIGTIVLVALVVWHLRRRRRHQVEELEYEEQSAATAATEPTESS